MGLLSKQNKEEVMRLNGVVDVNIFWDNVRVNELLGRKMDNFIQANLTKVLTDKDYTLRQLHDIWTNILGDCDINDFSVYYEDLHEGEFYIVLSQERLMVDMNIGY
jgi:hypothetical protein